MSVIEKTITFFHKTLGQDVITLSMHSAQAARIGLEALDGFVVRAAAKGLLVEVWIEDERRDYQFGDYVELLKRESLKVEANPYLDDEESFHAAARKDVDALNEGADEPNPYLDPNDIGWGGQISPLASSIEDDDDGHPKG